MPDAGTARHGPDDVRTQGRGAERAGAGTHPSAAEGHGGALLPALVARLREAGLDPDAEQLCDALWLARWTRGTGPSEPADGSPELSVPGTPPRESPVPGPTRTDTGPDTAAGTAGAEQGPSGGADRRVALHALPLPSSDTSRGGQYGDQREDGLDRAARSGYGRSGALHGPGALMLGVPAAPALPALLELQRALRPLQRYRPAAPPLRQVLDEEATAELSARAGGVIHPVFRGVTRAEATLQLIMDASSSMRAWDRMFLEFQQIFLQLGAFRDVHVHYLHRGPDGFCAVSRSPDPAAAPLNSAERLSDPTGRRVTVLVSDCAGPLWHSGRAHRLLHQLARYGPTAVLQPLPQRMWNRTGLPVTYGALSRGEGRSGAAVLKITEEPGGVPTTRPGALAVPVLPPVARALAAWARLLSGTGAGRISGAVGWVRADQSAAPAPPPGRRPSSLQLVSRFRSTASPAAGRLAVYLAAAPLYLPVMQLVQRTMLPDSGPSELAEVLLSGLLTGSRDDSAAHGLWYTFAPGVQEALLAPLGRDEALLVLKHCSQYVEQRFGKGGPNFSALALAQLGESDHGSWRGRGDVTAAGGTYGAEDRQDEERDSIGEGDENVAPATAPHPFAEVAARVLERFMPLPRQFAPYSDRGSAGPSAGTAHAAVESARALVRQYDTDSMVQYLIDAVQVLRSAAGRERQPGEEAELYAEYARCVLRLWQVQGGEDLLREAEEAAQRAAALPGAARERAVLASVLHAAADERRRLGDRRRALSLLRRADAEYTVACASPGLDPDEALRLTLQRVRAMEAQWRLSGDSSLLQGAVGMLEAFADVWPDQENRPLSLPLVHGRTLLRLARATADPEQSRLYAGQGARSLRKALAGEGAQASGAGTRVLLDLVDALLASDAGPDEASTLVEQALTTVGDQRMRASLQLRAGRVRAARYGRSGDARELTLAAERFALAARGMPRDSRAHSDLLAEWGGVMLIRAGLPDGQPHIGTAVRVLRECRTETPTDSDSQADRLLMLGRALMLRHRATEDRVDLREAEHLFALAAQESRDPLTAARCLLELGRSHFDAHRVLRRPTRLDEAADAFRDAADSARKSAAEPESPQKSLEAVELSAQANHWRGMAYEEAGRPRAARDAYRAAAQEWRRTPDGGGAAGESTAARLAELER